MSKNKHLSLDDRCKIQLMLDNKGSFSSIATQLEKDPTTISKEVRNHLQYKKTGAYRRSYNTCSKRISCQKSHICTECHAVRRYSLCRRCSMCNAFCKDFEKETCKRILKPPYVCNGCGKRSECSRESLGNKCPYDVFSFLYGQEILDLLGCHKVPPQDVTLNRSIFYKEDSHESR